MDSAMSLKRQLKTENIDIFENILITRIAKYGFMAPTYFLGLQVQPQSTLLIKTYVSLKVILIF